MGLLFSWVAIQGPETAEDIIKMACQFLLHRESSQRKACKTEAVSRIACGMGWTGSPFSGLGSAQMRTSAEWFDS